MRLFDISFGYLSFSLQLLCFSYLLVFERVLHHLFACMYSFATRNRLSFVSFIACVF